ncbi:glycosyl hydrolase, family 31 protein [Besnoitia besnoiti]|uniref:Glycosyl hydrolase, family 31 protein n=1 Tax=Besnoitia besnoiti TaxID=94643 RepID=A0A2A9M5L7_BESBE|nr:glycosyl hydrolase, family 31 protein [Besnoitia besnoiti]PFH31186.1 glycosyl hydrolase, family 31 protein [Besnoitia besnoiti]
MMAFSISGLPRLDSGALPGAAGLKDEQSGKRGGISSVFSAFLALFSASSFPPRRGAMLRVQRILMFAVFWLLLLAVFSPSSPWPSPAFSSLPFVFSPSFRVPQGGSRILASLLAVDEGAGFAAPRARQVLKTLSRDDAAAFLRGDASLGAGDSPPLSFASWAWLPAGSLPGIQFSAAIERDKFKLSCTQASFCHRYLHWVDLFAKKLPRASVSAPPLYAVDPKSLPRPTWKRREEGGSARAGGDRGGDQGDDSDRQEGEEGGGGPHADGGRGADETRGSRGQAPAQGVDEGTRGGDGLRLEARLYVFRHGIVRLKMREKLTAQQLEREREGELSAQERREKEAMQREPQDAHAPVFRLEGRYRRYDGYTADILLLEEDPAEGTEEEAKVSYSGNTTVVEFVANPPASSHADIPASFFESKPAETRTETKSEKKADEEGSGKARGSSCGPVPVFSPSFMAFGADRAPGAGKASEPASPASPGPASPCPASSGSSSAASPAFDAPLEGQGLPVRVVLQHAPFALRIYLHSQLVQEVNEKQLLNWEAFLPVHAKTRAAAEAEGRQQLEERLRREPGEKLPNAMANSTSQVEPAQQDAEAARVAELASAAGVDLTEKLKGLRGIEWRIGEPLGDDLDEEREVVNDIIVPLLHAGSIHDAVDLYRQGANEEAFDRFLDSKPFGPTAIGVDVTFWGASQVYGLFEHAAPFPLKSYTEPYRMYNLDVFNYELDSPFSTYGSMPFMIALHTAQGGGAPRAAPPRRTTTHLGDDLSENVASSRRRSSVSSAGSFFEGDESSRPGAALATGFLFLNPTEMWTKIRYDRGGEDLPESYAGLNEEEDETRDPTARRQKRSRHRMYQTFASRESLDWSVTEQHRKRRSRFEALRTWWTAEGGDLDLLMFLGPSPQDVQRQYHIATGLPAMAPLFALGKHQCRWNYNDQEDVLSVDRGFDTHNIPYDVIWIDIEHTIEKRYFTWDPKTFPSPQQMIEDIAAKDRKVVTIVDPHIKAVPDYYVYREALENNFLVRNPAGGIFHGHCWPGDSAYADFINPHVRKWWQGLFSYERYKYSTPDLWVWNDMNEPSVFSGPELSMPKDLLHMDGRLEHREIHNLYGHYHHRSTYEGLMTRGQGKQRPFVLTRATFIGSHRFGFVWTGDNRAEWTHLAASIPMILSAAVCGMSAVGADVDGFFADTSEELHIRWQQAGIFYPFYRSHAHMDTKRREPWLFSQQAIDIVREAVLVRYKMLPFWYTLFAEYSLYGDPVVRPLWWLDPLSPQMQQEQQSFLVGAELLVHPIVRPMEEDQKDSFEIDIAVPRDGGNVWIDFWTGLPFFLSSAGFEATFKYGVSLRTIPVLVRGGSILFTKERLKRSSTNMYHSPYTVHIYPSAPEDGESAATASGRLYVDDYNSFEYLSGKFVYERFVYYPEASEASQKKTWILRSHALPVQSLDSREGPMNGTYRDFPHREIERIVLWSLPSPPTRVATRRASRPRVEEASEKDVEMQPEREEEELLFSVEEIFAPLHLTQSDVLEGQTFYRVDVKLPKIEVGANDWEVLFTF